MTQEEKYKEALLEARAVLEPCLKYSKGKVREALDSIDNELKRFDSEDENIRKLLVWQVYRNIEDETNDLAQSVYDGIKGHDPDLEESIEDWKKCLAWLEKQKENPKSADSISADCMSDAKCENSWHKVDDSLPDNPREVLCKDAIGNFFIGRYYKSTQSWEVVMYDDCDKDNEDNPPVVKWCEIPSEKQKEQKPASISCGHENDTEWSEEDKKMLLSIINAFRNGTVSTIGQEEWLKNLPKRFNLQPKPEWSEEDEKMLDSIIKVVCGVGVQPNGLREKQVSWLKELRPQYHGDVTMTEAYKMGLEAGKASHWKPSEEQIEALVAATLRYQSTGLESLYEDLKKL